VFKVTLSSKNIGALASNENEMANAVSVNLNESGNCCRILYIVMNLSNVATDRSSADDVMATCDIYKFTIFASL
jgi:hypothetical protein